MSSHSSERSVRTQFTSAHSMPALVLLTLGLMVESAPGQSPPLSCPIPTDGAPSRYGRLHQIPTTPRPDDVSHKVVTPGGMVFETPRMVAATDVLTVWARDAHTLCFDLVAFGRDRHTCEVSGVAHRQSDATYLFSDDTAVVRFTFEGEDKVRVEPIGSGYQKRCEPSGRIERAVYSLDTKLD